jgi:hypothetical protein
MELNYYLIIITNLCIAITFLFSIILIIDELFSIGYFTFNYTYRYNYGSSISKFNSQQTIECETNRFNVYNNINFLFKDIFNKSYFNYLITIVATLITILCCIAYGVYFYYKFIVEQPDVCSYDEETNLSLPKQLLKCLCDECHKLIPNCTTNYFIVFIILIMIPLSYIFKTMFNINFTPNSDKILFQFIYICLFILLIFYYSFNLFSRKSETKYNDLFIYSLFTIIFISSGYIYKYIIDKYNNINLNTSNDIKTFYDIYKQAPPLKPQPIQKPRYKGTDLLSNFKYNDKDGDADYKIKKTIVDDYYKSIKNYDIDMKYYNERYNIYNSSLTSTKLGDRTNFFDITINILGLNNYMHIYIIVLLIISLISYSIFKDDISHICFIYLLVLLISLTIINSILYYNTYINKYIIYEPLAHYKSDITNANTALNIELNPNSGIVFYKKLTNNDLTLDQETNSDVKTGKQILEDIKKLVNISNYTSNITSNINNDINTYNTYFKFSSLSTSIENQVDINTVNFLYSISTITDKLCESTAAQDTICNIAKTNPIKHLLDNTSILSVNNKINIEKNKFLTLSYNKTSSQPLNISVKIPMTGYYRYCYYMAYQYNYLLQNKIPDQEHNWNTVRKNNIAIITPYEDKMNDLIFKLYSYKDENPDTHEIIIRNIDNKLNQSEDIISFTKNNELFWTIDEFIKNYINIIDVEISYNSRYTPISKIQYLKVSKNIISYDTGQYILKSASDYNIYYNVSYLYTINPYATDSIFVSTRYFKLPFKIYDSKNDEYMLKFNPINTYYIFINYTFSEKITNFKVNSKYLLGSVSQTLSINEINILNNIYAIQNLTTNIDTIPFVLNKISTTNNDKFKKIILGTIFNSICNIQSKFASNKLFNTIKRYKGQHPPSFNTTETYIMNYINKFDQNFINESIKEYTKILLKADDYISFYILLFNAFHSTYIDIKKTVNKNINYLINNSLILTESSQSVQTILEDITNKKLFLDENINSAANNIYKNPEIAQLYNQNKYIIDLIIALLENLLIAIKTEITKDPKYNKLCFPSSASLSTIEDEMNNEFNDPAAISNTAASSYNTIHKISPTDNKNDEKTKTLIIKLNNYLRYYFNIVIFLLDNIKLNTNTAEIDAITTNFNFYNQDDIIKTTIQKQLIINCDYYNKYNKLDSKQLSYFKINADNVNYNFPILMVIFLIVLGEPIFIKS